MMFGILVYQGDQWELAAEETSMAFNAVLRDHARKELSEAAYADWLAEPRGDMQMRILCTEDFAKWFPTNVVGLKLSLVHYAGNCIAGLSPLVVASYMGEEFLASCPRTELTKMWLRGKIKRDSDDDQYEHLRSLGEVDPYRAIIGMPLAMAYYGQGGVPKESEIYCGNVNKVVTWACPKRGPFFDRMLDAYNDGMEIRRVNAIKVVGNES